MTALLDVNVLVALFDPAHLHHDSAHEWLEANRRHGWATCPLTENALIRILANPSYPGRRTTIADIAKRLCRFRRSGDHAFWTDDISLTDESVCDFRHVQGHRQLTDVYLLGLAVHHDGRLATFDRKITPAAIRGASHKHVTVISA